VLAWRGSLGHSEQQARALQFLLRTTGVHYERDKRNPAGHDPAIKGWPWIEGTHSWVEPTSLSVIAATACGFGDHPRIREAVRLLVDRQLPRGGWNYGNTFVFGRELNPAPESTGAALHALEGRVSRSQVQPSLDYLQRRIADLRTPLALGWSLLGLKSWGRQPSDTHQLIERCLMLQERFGPYQTTALSLLLCSAVAQHGLYTRV
jgi:hypothetical protein